MRDVEKRQEEEKAKAQDARAEEARLAAAAKEKLGRLRAAAEAKEAQVRQLHICGDASPLSFVFCPVADRLIVR